MSEKIKKYPKPCCSNIGPIFFSYWDAVHADSTEKIIDLNFDRLCSAIVCNVMTHQFPPEWGSNQAVNVYFDIPPLIYSSRLKSDGQSFYTLTRRHLSDRKSVIKELNNAFKRFCLQCIQIRTTVKKSRQNHRIKLTLLRLPGTNVLQNTN